MTDEVRIENRDGVMRIIGGVPAVAKALLRDAINDIADRLENEARTRAPEGTEESGTYPGKTPLKEHPVDRKDTVAGEADTRNPLFGGGFAIRGASGFLPGVGQAGDVVAHTEVSVAKIPRHAIWVHEGTANAGTGRIFARPGNMFHFTYHGVFYRRKSVRGQRPQPYLTEAYTYINATYVPIRVEEFRERLRVSL